MTEMQAALISSLERAKPRAGPRSLSRENAYGETNRRSGMSGIDWVFRLSRVPHFSPKSEQRETRAESGAHGDHYSPSAICKRVLFMALQTL